MTPHGLRSVAHFVAGQAGVISPLLFLLFLWAIGLAAAMLIQWYGKRNVHGAPAEILPWLVVVPPALTWMVFALASFFSKSQTNWPAAAYTTLSVILGLMMATWVGDRGARRALAWIAIIPAMLVTGYAHYEAALPTLPMESSVFDKLRDQHGLARWLDTLRKQSASKQSAAVLADNYRLASLLQFYLADRPRTDAPFEEGSGAQYVLWRTNGKPWSPDEAWYLTRFKDDGRMTRLFRKTRLEGVYVETRAGVVTHTYYAYFGSLRKLPHLQLARHENPVTPSRTVSR